jgi:hypothetical protein
MTLVMKPQESKSGTGVIKQESLLRPWFFLNIDLAALPSE